MEGGGGTRKGVRGGGGAATTGRGVGGCEVLCCVLLCEGPLAQFVRFPSASNPQRPRAREEASSHHCQGQGEGRGGRVRGRGGAGHGHAGGWCGPAW